MKTKLHIRLRDSEISQIIIFQKMNVCTIQIIYSLPSGGNVVR
jgi:hypothetical protein